MEVKEILDKVEKIRANDKEIADLETKIKELVKERNELSEKTIPKLLEEYDLESMETSEYLVSTKTVYYGSLKKDNQEAGIKFLVENGQWSCIKAKLLVEDNLNKEGRPKLCDRVAKLLPQDVPYDIKYEINHQTLKKALREIMEAPDCIEYFGYEDLVRLHGGDVEYVLATYFDYDEEMIADCLRSGVEFPQNELLLEAVAEKLLGVFAKTETVIKEKKQ